MEDFSDEEPGPSAPKRKKSQPSYRSKFNSGWVKDFPFIGPVKGDVYR